MRGNTVSIAGNATRDMEFKQATSGNWVAEFGVAWNSRRRDAQGSWQDVPHFFDVKCWLTDGQKGALPPVVKGQKVAVVDGHLAYESWEAGDGSKRSKVVVMVDDPIGGLVVGVPRRKAQGGYGQQAAPQPYRQQPTQQQGCQQPQAQQYAPASIYDEQIPF